LCGDGGANLAEGGRDIGGCVDNEGGAGVADGDADELHTSLMSAEGAEQGVVFLGLGGEPLLLAHVPTQSDIEENGGANFISITKPNVERA
jgi:hypothetical protein